MSLFDSGNLLRKRISGKPSQFRLKIITCKGRKKKANLYLTTLVTATEGLNCAVKQPDLLTPVICGNGIGGI